MPQVFIKKCFAFIRSICLVCMFYTTTLQNVKNLKCFKHKLALWRKVLTTFHSPLSYELIWWIPYYCHKTQSNTKQFNAQQNQHCASITPGQSLHCSQSWTNQFKTRETTIRWKTRSSHLSIKCGDRSHKYLQADSVTVVGKLRKCIPTVPVCNARRCGEHWGWTFSSHQHLERSFSASQNTLWGALAWRVRNEKVTLVVWLSLANCLGKNSSFISKWKK